MKNYKQKIKHYNNKISNLDDKKNTILKKIESLELELNNLKNQIIEEEELQTDSQKRIDGLVWNKDEKQKEIDKEEELQTDSQKRINSISKKSHELENMISKNQNQSNQHNYEQMIIHELISEMVNVHKHEIQRNISIVSIVAIFAIVVIFFSFFQPVMMGTEYNLESNSILKTGYVIQNLIGDTIDTWVSWQIIEGEIIKISISQKDENFDIIKDVILSKESIEIDDSLLHKGPKGSTSTYFLGWSGALEHAAQKPTKFPIPVNFEVLDAGTKTGDIVIETTTTINIDGYSGYTTSITDEENNQILKSKITIFNINNLSKSELESVVRHELGHALGLAHSTAPEDLMAPVIATYFPYISECDIDAIRLLYDGGKTSQVTCQK